MSYGYNGSFRKGKHYCINCNGSASNFDDYTRKWYCDDHIPKRTAKQLLMLILDEYVSKAIDKGKDKSPNNRTLRVTVSYNQLSMIYAAIKQSKGDE